MASDAIVIPPGGGEVIGDAPDRRVELLSDHETLNATWSRFGPRRDGADLHVHREHTDLFYVLAGELTLKLGPEDEQVPAPAGTLVRVPPLVVHGFRNGTDEELRYLNLHAPGQRFADYLRAMRDGRDFSYDQHDPPPHGGRSPADATIGAAEVITDRPGLHVTRLADVDEIAVAEVRGDERNAAAPVHVHDSHVESLYVLEGELQFAAAGTETRAPAGTWLQVPPGVPHTFAYAGEVRFLAIRTPNRRLDQEAP